MKFLFTFFLKNNVYSKRTIWLGLVSFVPVFFSVLILILKPLISDNGASVFSYFPQMAVFLFIHFLLPVMSIFIGTAVIGDEIDGRTLTYLITKPIPRHLIVIVKLLSGIAVTSIAIMLSLGLTYSVMMIDDGFSSWVQNIDLFFGTAGILFLGLLTYLPLFSFLGGMLKRPVLAGLFFTFGWEATVSFMPGNIKYLTISHYLHTLSQKLYHEQFISGKKAILSLLFKSKELSSVSAILILLIIAIVFIVLSALLLYIKEYRLEKG